MQHRRDGVSVERRQVQVPGFGENIGVVYDGEALVARVEPRRDHVRPFDDDEDVPKPRRVRVQTPQRVQKLVVVSLATGRVLLIVDRRAAHRVRSRRV